MGASTVMYICYHLVIFFYKDYWVAQHAYTIGTAGTVLGTGMGVDRN